MPDFRLNCWFLDCAAGFQIALPRLDRREAAGVDDGKLVLAPRSGIWLDLGSTPKARLALFDFIDCFYNPKRRSSIDDFSLRDQD